MHQSLADSVKITQNVVSQRLNNSSANGADLDMAGWDGVLFVLNLGATDATVDMVAQSSASGGGAGYANITGAAISQISATGDNRIVAIDVWRPTNRFVRSRVTVGAGTTGADFGVLAIQYKATGRMPVTQALAELVKVREN